MSRNDIIRRYMELIREASQKKDVFMGNLLCRQHHVDHKAIQVLRGLGWVDTLPSVGTRWVGPIPHDEKELRTMAIKLLRCKNSNAKKPVKVTPIAPEKPAQAEPSMRLVATKPQPGWVDIKLPATQPQAPAAGDGALKPRKRELNLLWGLFKINW